MRLVSEGTYQVDFPMKEGELDLPRHLKSFANEISRKHSYIREPDEAKYADVAMALVNIAGKADAADLAIVKEFITAERGRLRSEQHAHERDDRGRVLRRNQPAVYASRGRQ